jgi:hypothetical protein
MGKTWYSMAHHQPVWKVNAIRLTEVVTAKMEAAAEPAEADTAVVEFWVVADCWVVADAVHPAVAWVAVVVTAGLSARC